MKKSYILTFLIISSIIGLFLIGIGITGKVVYQLPNICNSNNECKETNYCCKPEINKNGFCVSNTVCQDSLQGHTIEEWTNSLEKAEKKEINDQIITGALILISVFIISYLFIITREKVKPTKKKKK